MKNKGRIFREILSVSKDKKYISCEKNEMNLQTVMKLQQKRATTTKLTSLSGTYWHKVKKTGARALNCYAYSFHYPQINIAAVYDQ